MLLESVDRDSDKLRRTQSSRITRWRLPSQTKSLCPVCLKVVEAELFEENDKVIMSKSCAEHGHFKELISGDAKLFMKMRRVHYERPRAVENLRRNRSQCPDECGLCEQHLSSPAMVNIDLTNRCNLNCPICFANSNAVGRVYEVTLEQVKQMLDDAAAMKPKKAACLQFVGGEPTIHKDFLECVRQASLRGFGHVQVASNGVKFAQSAEFAQAAGQAGLNQIYLQFDGLDDEIYKQTRGKALLETKLAAVENIRKANIRIVLVPTIVKGMNDKEVGAITRFAMANTDVISGISWQPVSITGRIDEQRRRQMRYTMADLARDLEEQLGFMDMHRDWWPFSTVSPFLRLMTAVKGELQISVSCHPHCGMATYLAVDKETNQAVPLPAFVDIEQTMEAVDKMAARVEKYPLLRKMTVLSAMKVMKKHFHKEKAPPGWEFDEFLDFIKSFADFSEQHEDMAQLISELSEKRFGTLLMAAMHFQDVYNYEIDRSRHCVILYAAPNGRFYPFCTWNSGPCHRYHVEKAYSRPPIQIHEIGGKAAAVESPQIYVRGELPG
jgi:uncharacterized radical SAM superfamily Fe-S cluster-containing enzyme